MSDRIRQKVLYSGHVQGVGFRATASSIARGHDVGGHVKNLPDGRVELVVEGNRQSVRAFLDEVDERMGGHVREKSSSDESPQGESHFRVEH